MKKELSPRDILPLEIASYLQDTTQLMALKSGAYLHLLMHCWMHGSLPNNQEELAAIARCTPQEWAHTIVSLSHYFYVGEDGRMRSKGAEKRLEKNIAKYNQLKAAGRKAVNIRWARYREQKAKREAELAQGEAYDRTAIAEDRIDAVPSHPSPGSAPEFSPHTPLSNPTSFPIPHSLPQGGLERPTLQPPLGDGRARPSPGEDSAGVRAQAPIASRRAVPAGKQSETKAKRPDFAPRTGSNGSGEPHVPSGVNGRLEKTLPLVQQVPRMRSESLFSDRRFETFKNELLKFWAGQNPGHPGLPWITADDRALAAFLAGDPNVDLDRFKQLLVNRAQSGVNPLSLPRNWVRHLEEFAGGPLDRFSRPAPARRIY